MKWREGDDPYENEIPEMDAGMSGSRIDDDLAGIWRQVPLMTILC